MIKNRIIAIDARMIEMSGIGTYIQHLLGHGIYDYALGDENAIRKYDKDIKVIPYTPPIYSLKEQLFFPNKIVKKLGIQLVHFPHYNVPLNYHGRFVVTVHDLTHIILPDFLGNRLKYYYAKILMLRALNNSEHIFTVSQNSKKDICNSFNIHPDKVSITYNAVDSSFRKKNSADVTYLYEKYNIPRDKKILLYVGNLKPHKNLCRLLEAISNLKESDHYCLVLVGKAFNSLRLNEQEKKLNIEDLVVHVGVVSKTELIDLYNLADLFVFPSLYEGFGIPLLEAMACGTPVAASNNSSIPEVVGNAAILFDAYSVEDITTAIQKVNDKKYMDELVESGYARVGLFRWEKTVDITRRDIEDFL